MAMVSHNGMLPCPVSFVVEQSPCHRSSSTAASNNLIHLLAAFTLVWIYALGHGNIDDSDDPPRKRSPLRSPWRKRSDPDGLTKEQGATPKIVRKSNESPVAEDDAQQVERARHKLFRRSPNKKSPTNDPKDDHHHRFGKLSFLHGMLPWPVSFALKRSPCHRSTATSNNSTGLLAAYTVVCTLGHGNNDDSDDPSPWRKRSNQDGLTKEQGAKPKIVRTRNESPPTEDDAQQGERARHNLFHRSPHQLEPTAAVGPLNRIILRLSRKKYFFLRRQLNFGM